MKLQIPFFPFVALTSKGPACLDKGLDWTSARGRDSGVGLEPKEFVEAQTMGFLQRCVCCLPAVTLHPFIPLECKLREEMELFFSRFLPH